MCVQNFDDSRGFAIRITYRISLRSSSLWEPRHPLLKVVCHFYLIRRGHPPTNANTCSRLAHLFCFMIFTVHSRYKEEKAAGLPLKLKLAAPLSTHLGFFWFSTHKKCYTDKRHKSSGDATESRRSTYQHTTHTRILYY